MNIPSLQSTLQTKKIATIILIIMLTQFVYLEGYGVSIIKVGLMALMPLIFFFKVPFISKGFFWGLIYILSISIIAFFHSYIRFSTIGFLALYVFTSVVFYNLIYSNAFTLEYFIKLLKYIIFAYTICLICQQIFVLIGIKFMPLINLNNQLYLSIDKLPSLSIEPSHTARILTAVMFGYLKCTEFKQGTSVKIQQLFSTEHKWVTIGFFWTMLTMGSGTAFVGIGILSLYFINRQTVFYIIPLFIAFFAVSSQLEIKQFDRATNLGGAVLTGDIQSMKEADGSGASRIIPLINTFANMDLTKEETWIGVGTTTIEHNTTGWKRDDVKIGAIEQYGILTYFISLLFIFNCFIRKILSIETLIFILLLGCSLVNVYYVWGILMLFGTIKYFDNYDVRYE